MVNNAVVWDLYMPDEGDGLYKEKNPNHTPFEIQGEKFNLVQQSH